MPNDEWSRSYLMSQVSSAIQYSMAVRHRLQGTAAWRTIEVGLQTLVAGLVAAAADVLITGGFADPETPRRRIPAVVGDNKPLSWGDTKQQLVPAGGNCAGA